MARKKEVKQSIGIPRPDLRKARITIEGISPLLVNRFDEKCRKEIEEKYQKKAKTKEAPLTPDQQFKASLYRMPNKKNSYGVPVAGLKQTAVKACRYVEGMTMTLTQGAFHIINDNNGLIEIKSKSGPSVDERLVRVGNFGNKKPATRYRAKFEDWEIQFDLIYNAGVISDEQLLNLYEHAGFSVGLCEYRPENKGSLGMFRVKRR